MKLAQVLARMLHDIEHPRSERPSCQFCGPEAERLLATPEGKALSTLVGAAVEDGGFSLLDDDLYVSRCWACDQRKAHGHHRRCPVDAYLTDTEPSTSTTPVATMDAGYHKP